MREPSPIYFIMCITETKISVCECVSEFQFANQRMYAIGAVSDTCAKSMERVSVFVCATKPKSKTCVRAFVLEMFLCECGCEYKRVLGVG